MFLKYAFKKQSIKEKLEVLTTRKLRTSVYERVSQNMAQM